MAIELGVDIGGTFTDVVASDEHDRMWSAKVPTTPANLVDCFLDGIDAVLSEAARDGHTDLAIDRIVHGTTIATNLVVQRAGAPVALLTTRGFRDTIHIRQGRGYIAGLPEDQITNIHMLKKPSPLVSKQMIGEIDERIDCTGAVVVKLNEERAREVIRKLSSAGASSFAICLLWSFVNETHEQRLREIVEEECPGAYISISCEIAPRKGEYARTVATVINSYVGPTVRDYFSRLERDTTAKYQSPVSVLQSTGGSVSTAEAGRNPVRLLGSGPVAGTMASAALADNVIAIDMGGTTFDVSLIVEGSPLRSNISVIHQYEYSVPTIELQSIGSGGGSIVWVDELGTSLRVGPESAGAEPGPACYAKGGTQPTVTDCNVITGFLDPGRFLGGKMKLDPARAHAALDSNVASKLGMNVVEAARGAIRIVDAQMADLVRQVTIGRGYDPRDFVVCAYGGAGPLHAPAFARELGVSRVVIPRGSLAAVWSAYGAATADLSVVVERSLLRNLPVPADELESELQALEKQAATRLVTFGAAESGIMLQRFADLKYGMQAHVLEVPLEPELDEQAMGRIPSSFGEIYERIFGSGTAYREAGVQLTAVRVQAVAPVTNTGQKLRPPARSQTVTESPRTSMRAVCWDAGRGFEETPVFPGQGLIMGQQIAGPAILELGVTTIPVHPGQSLEVTPAGDLHIHV
ncbi:MAG: hydantoinase/oxoprolinase family protein [Gammaproteobacteria bacterium]|nr:hydantoinase/oxoprolinase family protein [Gammaproteobacteria bacterium]